MFEILFAVDNEKKMFRNLGDAFLDLFVSRTFRHTKLGYGQL